MLRAPRPRGLPPFRQIPVPLALPVRPDCLSAHNFGAFDCLRRLVRSLDIRTIALAVMSADWRSSVHLFGHDYTTIGPSALTCSSVGQPRTKWTKPFSFCHP